MLQKKFKKFKEEALYYDPKLKFFILSIMACAFFITCEYAVIRPTSNAIFLSHFSAKTFPYVWLATVPLNFLIVFLYNRFLKSFGCLKMLFVIVSLVIGINCLCALFIEKYSFLAFFHYIFKDIYILLMFKQLWSLIHMTIDTSKAKYLYGVLFGMGGVGAIIGSLVPGFLAVQVGSQNLFYFTIPIYLMLFLSYALAFKYSKKTFTQDFSDEKRLSLDSFKVVFQKKFLTYILLLVVFMQMITAFVDYQFNIFLEKNIIDLDLKTQYYGRLIGIVNILTTIFQLVGGFILIHFLGLKKSHFLAPLILCSNALLFLFFPTFAMISFSLVIVKSMDHSFFGIIREMLYIPLKPEEKFKAKAVIDVFAYRSAKAFASLLLLSLQFFVLDESIFIVSIFSICTFILWGYVVYLMFRESYALQSEA